MAAISTILTAASLAFTAYSTMEQMDAQDEAKSAQQSAAAEERKARDEQKAAQASQAAAERRAQMREERIKRARIMQSSVGSGVSGSSGEAGATGSLSTQLSSNIGFNVGQLQSASNISNYGQNAADFLSSANNKIAEANQWGSMASLSMSIFDKSGGFNSIFKSGTQSPAPVPSAVIKPVR